MNTFMGMGPGLTGALLITVKVTLLFGAVAAVLVIARRASAALRHLLIASAFAGGLILPALTVAVPSWEVVPALKWGGERGVSRAMSFPFGIGSAGRDAVAYNLYFNDR